VSFAAPATSSSRRLTLAAVVALALALALLLTLVAPGAPSAGAPLTHASAARIQFLTDSVDDLSGSLYNVNQQINADSYWSNGYTGAGIDVALIDSGTAPVDALNGADKVVYGPDVSFESGQDNLRNLDTFGHGTHMAGIIAGLSDGFHGVAYGSRIISLKAADAHGQTDLAQIVAEIKWVTQHAHDDGMNIRVLNLSFGAIPTTSYRKDDLAYAVEKAWNAGIVTVVAAGNEGVYSSGLDTPAFDPFVIAVGADNPKGTTDISDDNVSSFSSRGNGTRDPDVIAPGKSVVSLRVPGSYLDIQYPDARVGDPYFRGSGTSQAAAVVSGAAALLLSQRPNMSPDQLKRLLMATARPIPNTSYSTQGAGLIDLSAAFDTDTPNAGQYWQHSNGSPQGVWWNVADATGNSWSTASAGNSWSGNSWTSTGWTGPGWDDADFVAGNSWSSVGWLDASLTNSRERGVCTDWFLDKMRDANGVSWGRKTKTVHESGAGSRIELGVSWGKRGAEIRANRSQTLDFCEWMHEQWESKQNVRVDPSGGESVDTSNNFRELGVSWGKRRMLTGVTEYRRGWSVQ
jgi:serine protease AprX